MLLNSKVHIFSDPVFCTSSCVTGTDATSCWAKTVRYVWRNCSSEYNFNISRDPDDIHAHDRNLTFIEYFWDETNTHLQSRVVCSNGHLHGCMFNDIDRWNNKNEAICSNIAWQWRPGCWCWCGPGREIAWTCNEKTSMGPAGAWDAQANRMVHMFQRIRFSRGTQIWNQ